MDDATTRRLRDIVDASATVNRLRPRNRLGFESNLGVQLAMARLTEIIGEAASHVSEEVRNLHPELPWREMIGMRDRLHTGQLETDPELLWLFVSVEIPRLAPQVAAVLHSMPEQVG